MTYCRCQCRAIVVTQSTPACLSTCPVCGTLATPSPDYVLQPGVPHSFDTAKPGSACRTCGMTPQEILDALSIFWRVEKNNRG